MKIVLAPTSRYQMKSMRKMSELQPKMNAMKEKYKDDPQTAAGPDEALQRGENHPAGGCCPYCYSSRSFTHFWRFNSTIELRQASLCFWIHDLLYLTYCKPSVLRFRFSGSMRSPTCFAYGTTMFISRR